MQGIWHIWTGYDHILFLIVLLIPAVFQSTATGREAVPSFREALLRVVIIVSAFTLHDFWHIAPGAAHTAEFTIFTRDFAISGGLLMIVGLGAGPFALDNRPKGGKKR